MYCDILCVVMIRRSPQFTRTVTLVPYTTLYRSLPAAVEKLKRARLFRRQMAGVLRFLGVPASDFEDRHEAPTIAAAAAPGKAPARQAHRHPPPPAGALPKARAAPILAALSDSSQADAAPAPDRQSVG